MEPHIFLRYMGLFVNEIFYSIQGETTTAGFPSLFIRLAGCNLNCSYCDTPYARGAGKICTVEKLMGIVKKYPQAHHVTLTGGEPLMQYASLELIDSVIRAGQSIQVETNGSITLKDVNRLARKIADVKTPSSGEADSFLYENLNYLGEFDELKFVISDEKDFIFSSNFIEENSGNINCTINFSPAYGNMDMSNLSNMILKSGLGVRLNIQLHRVIWPGRDEEKISIEF